MRNRQILINATMSIGQVIVTGMTLFILYRFLLNHLGVEQFGVWSVVSATTSLVNIGNLGFSGCIVKFVAKYLAVGEKESVIGVIHTATASICVIVGMILGAFYPFAEWLLRFVIPPSHLSEALSILPYAMASIWISVIAGAFQGALDGYQRIDISRLISVAKAIVILLLSFFLVPTYGLIGLAYASVIQSCIVLLAAWMTLKKLLPSLSLIPHRWSKKLFREMIVYGLHFQMITFSSMFYDPITKGLLAKYGGLSMTGFYEMASRMIMQLRGLLVAANEVLIPMIAELQENNPEIIRKVYQDSYELNLYIALPYFSVIIALAPVISRAWIGYYEPDFLFFYVILAIGWLVNILYAPSYTANLGIGNLKLNATGQVIMAGLNMGLGLLFGKLYGGEAVVVAWVISLVVGSFSMLLLFHYKNGIGFSRLFPKEFIFLGLSGVTGVFMSFLLNQLLNDRLSTFALAGVILMAVCLSSSIPIWNHTMRKRLARWLMVAVLKESKTL